MEVINMVFIKTLGIALFHSIWQATLIALIMSMALSLVKKKHANLRYLIATSSLFSLFFISVFTFFRVYKLNLTDSSELVGESIKNVYSQVILVSSEDGYLALLKDIMLENIHWITLVWAIGMLFFLLKVVLGLKFTNKLRQSSRVIDNPQYKQLLEVLKQKAGILRKIELKESIQLLQPSVVGFLKPVIYFPIGIVNKLDTHEVEAILAHELAHIIRNDFLVNIAQSIVETIFYFHPAVWWISANIRSERENACDDLAIAVIGDKIKYAKSLLLLQEWEVSSNSGLAMSLSNRATPLFERMKRILSQPKNKHEMKQKILASLILMSSIIWISATEAPEPQEKVSAVFNSEILDDMEDKFGDAESINKVITDTIPKRIQESKSTIVELKDGKIKRLNIDGVEIPEDEFEDHSFFIDDLDSKKYWHFDTSYFDALKDLQNFEFENQENLEQMLAEMKVFGDTIWPSFEGSFNFDHLDDLGENLQFEFDRSFKVLDSVFTEMDFDGDFDFQFDNMDTMRFSFDTLRFDMDSLKSKMEDMKIYFEGMGDQFENYFDSIDFSKIGSDIRIYFDTMDFSFIEDGFESLENFEFPDFDGDFDFVYGNSLERAFIRELKKDDLYQEDGNSIKLGYDSLEINGKKQDREKQEKYKKIYEDKTGIDLLDGSNLNIEIDNKSKDHKLKKL